MGIFKTMGRRRTAPAPPKDSPDKSYRERPPLNAVHTLNRRNGDGVWHCCMCRNEPLLHLQDGPHPFGKLVCDCGHVICACCTTSPVLEPFLCQDADPVIIEKLHETREYGQVCPCGQTDLAKRDAGLSRIAHELKHLGEGNTGLVLRFLGRVCDCGEMSRTSWFRFSIGSSREYKEGDPDEVYQRVVQRLMEGATSPE